MKGWRTAQEGVIRERKRILFQGHEIKTESRELKQQSHPPLRRRDLIVPLLPKGRDLTPGHPRA